MTTTTTTSTKDETANALRAAAGKDVAKRENKPRDIAALLSDPRVAAQIKRALPRHMTTDRLLRTAMTELRRTPALAQCTQASFLGALMQCAQLGLEPGGALGHCYLLPFDNKRRGIREVQFIIGYRGMIDLARRSGQMISLEARAVYAKDKFQVTFGLHHDLVHEPAWEEPDRGALRAVYAVARLVGGGEQYEVMSRAEIERVRAQSKASSSGPWVTHFEEMAKKTVIRRLFKYLPVSIEIQKAVGLDEQGEASGVEQELDDPITIDNDTGEISGNGDDRGEAQHPPAAASGSSTQAPPPASGDELFGGDTTPKGDAQ